MEKEIQIFNYGIYSNFTISSVEKILTLDCFLNAFSSDQIAHFNFSASAKYEISFACGAKSLAPERKDSYSDLEIIFILFNRNSVTKSSSEAFNLENFSNLSLLLLTSSNKYCGERNSNPLSDNKPNKSKVKLLLINAENKTFASTIKIIYNNPCLLAMPNLTSSASFFACFSVNSLLETISLATENFSLSTSSLTTLSRALLNLISKLCGTSNLTITSAILSPLNINLLELVGGVNTTLKALNRNLRGSLASYLFVPLVLSNGFPAQAKAVVIINQDDYLKLSLQND